MNWVDTIGDRTQISVDELPKKNKFGKTSPPIRLKFDAGLKQKIIDALRQRGWHCSGGHDLDWLRDKVEAENFYLRDDGVSYSERDWVASATRYHVLTVTDGITVTSSVTTSLKKQNSKPEATSCAQCNGLLRTVEFGIKYCPVCEG
jgi:hypothetical protein